MWQFVFYIQVEICSGAVFIKISVFLPKQIFEVFYLVKEVGSKRTKF